MFISILVPIYNVEKYLERCARSLFEQTYREHIRIISHEKNRGLAAARNTCVDNCQTDFLMHVDSDDYLEKKAVELLVKKQK